MEHDSGEGRLYALSLMDALFRHIIEVAAGMYVELCSDEEKETMDADDAEYYTSESEIIDLLKKCKICFEDRFTDEQKDYLNSIFDRKFSERGILVDYDEMDRIIKGILNVKNEKAIHLNVS